MEPYFSLQTCSDECLCARAISGERSAEECLAARYSRLVRMCARPYFLAGGDSEDLIQEGMIGLLAAIRGFDQSKGASFRTYAEVCIQNRLHSAMKSAGRGKHAPLNSSISFADSHLNCDAEPYACGNDPQRVENPETVIIGREERARWLETLYRSLSGFEKTVLKLYLSGLSYHEIAHEVGKPLKSVDNAVQRIRRKAAPFIASGEFSVS